MNNHSHRKSLDALDLAISDNLTHFIQRLSQTPKHMAWDNLLTDAQSLHRIFSSAQIIRTREPHDSFPGTYSLKHFMTTPPDAILIFGNNDLHQVDHVAWLCKHLAREQLPAIFISGKGGHGTTHGHCFGITEAEIFAQRLMDWGIPSEHLQLECKATNTGENIKFVEVLMAASPPQHILIAGTPSALLRQLHSYKKQSILPWQSICTLPPEWETIKKNYYLTPIASVINFLSLLCEATKYLHYSLATDYIHAQPLMIHADSYTNHLSIKKLMQILIKYYYCFHISTGEDTSAINAEKISTLYIKYFYDGNDKELSTLKYMIKTLLDTFQIAFKATESCWMKPIKPQLSARQHTLKLYDCYTRYHLDLPNIEKCVAHAPTLKIN